MVGTTSEDTEGFKFLRTLQITVVSNWLGDNIRTVTSYGRHSDHEEVGRRDGDGSKGRLLEE